MLKMAPRELLWYTIYSCLVMVAATPLMALYCNFDVQLMYRLLATFGIPGFLVTFMLSTVVVYTRKTYKAHKIHHNYPGPARTSFYTGNYTEMRTAQDNNRLFDLLRDWALEHGDTFIFWRNEKPKFFTTDPDIIRSMLTEITIFNKVVSIPNRTLFGQRITGTSSFLTISGGTQWAQKRKVMSSYFTKMHMTNMYDSCHDYIKRGIEKQMERDVTPGTTSVDLVNFYGELFQFFLGALGFDLDTELVSKNAKWHNLVIQRILKWVPQQFRPWYEQMQMKMNPEVQETTEMVCELRKICRYLIDEKIKEIQKKGLDPNDIIHHVITSNRNATDDEEKQLMIQMDDMMTIFLVIDNMAKTMSTIFTQVMRDERVYKKLREEVRSADTSTLQTMDKSLVYAEQVILEVLRLHPTLMRGIRVPTKRTELPNGLVIQKKTLIFFGQLVLHRHPKYWKKPDEFLPERFATGTQQITPFTYLPFVAGPRVCMGKHLAMLSMKLSILYTLKNYDLRPPVGEEKDMEWDNRFTIVKPTKGHNAIFEPIEKTAGS